MSVWARNPGLLTPKAILGKHFSDQENKIVPARFVKTAFSLLGSSKSHLPLSLSSWLCLLFYRGNSNYCPGSCTTPGSTPSGLPAVAPLPSSFSPVTVKEKSLFLCKLSCCHCMWHPPLSYCPLEILLSIIPLLYSFLYLFLHTCSFSSAFKHIHVSPSLKIENYPLTSHPRWTCVLSLILFRSKLLGSVFFHLRLLTSGELVALS